MKYENKRDAAEFITRGKTDIECAMLYGPRDPAAQWGFTRSDAIEHIAKTWTPDKIRAERDALLASNARGDLETYVTMTVDGGYGAEFQAYSWYHADEQATAAGYAVLDWTDSMEGKNILVVAP